MVEKQEDGPVADLSGTDDKSGGSAAPVVIIAIMALVAGIAVKAAKNRK